jgi:hypothetical protein
MSEMTQRVGKLAEGIDLFAAPKVPQPAPQAQQVEQRKRFNYSGLPPAAAKIAQQAVDDIRRWQKAAVVDTGLALLKVKAALGHGAFGDWLDAEFGMGHRTATNYMNAAAFAEGKSEKISILPSTALYALASPDADQKVVAEVLAEIEAGAVIPAQTVRDRLNDATRARIAAASVKSAEEIKKEKENERKRRQAQVARDKQREAESAAFDLKAKANAARAANHLVKTYQGARLTEFCNLMFFTNWQAVTRELHALKSAEPQEAEQ